MRSATRRELSSGGYGFRPTLKLPSCDPFHRSSLFLLWRRSHSRQAHRLWRAACVVKNHQAASLSRRIIHRLEGHRDLAALAWTERFLALRLDREHRRRRAFHLDHDGHSGLLAVIFDSYRLWFGGFFVARLRFK